MNLCLCVGNLKRNDPISHSLTAFYFKLLTLFLSELYVCNKRTLQTTYILFYSLRCFCYSSSEVVCALASTLTFFDKYSRGRKNKINRNEGFALLITFNQCWGIGRAKWKCVEFFQWNPFRFQTFSIWLKLKEYFTKSFQQKIRLKQKESLL
jgi:hypothetical protein